MRMNEVIQENNLFI